MAAPTPSRPVFVVVPGATQTPSHYAYLLHLLHLCGYGTLTALLPSVGSTPLHPVSAADDAEFVRTRMLLPLLDVERHDIVLIMHSYAGVPGSAAARGLGREERRRQGKTTAVVGQIFIATILSRGGDGKTLIENLDGTWPEHIDIYRGEDRIKCDSPQQPMFHDVPDLLAEAAEQSAISHSLSSFESPCPPCSWIEPDFRGRCAYIRALDDRAVPFEIQRKLLRRSQVDHWIVRDIKTSHTPHLAKPEQLRDIILEVTWMFEKGVGENNVDNA